ncbi:ABC transporter permease [Aerococcus urinaeequi]|uniref:ABC transporter permease n=1 Tax=Aerococcus urinaeequi TaxID=51665 RepID=UPI003D6BF031
MAEDHLFKATYTSPKDFMDQHMLAHETQKTDTRIKQTGYWTIIWQRFARNKAAVFGLICFMILLAATVFAGVIAPYNPDEIVGEFLEAPTSTHWLGTDEIGRDIFSRLLYGGQVSVFVGIVSVLIYAAIGTSLGLLAGFLGGVWDFVIMRLTEVIMSFPYFLVVLVAVGILGPSIWNVTIVIGLFGWAPLCRIVRAEVMKLKGADYIQAAVASGYSTGNIVFKQIVPNILSPILVNMTFGISTSIITEASLSFLGVGVVPPTASWGNLLTAAQSLSVLTMQSWRWVPVGLAVFLAVLSINFIGEGLRSAVEGEI